MRSARHRAGAQSHGGVAGALGLALVASPAQLREMDRQVIEELEVPGRVLMELAGAGTAALIMARVPRTSAAIAPRAVVLCGGGNNGGDGYVIARHLRDAGWRVLCIATRAPEALGGDAHANAALWSRLGGETRVVNRGPTASMGHQINHANVVVDALFGTGLSRAIEGPVGGLIAMANGASHPLKVAVDLPSGLDGTTGMRLSDAAFRADLTATYGLPKSGSFQADGPALCGELVVVPLGLPQQLVAEVGACAACAMPWETAPLIPARPGHGHKGTFGHVAVIGGRRGQEGAALLACRGAARAGSGLVSWAADHAPSSAAALGRLSASAGVMFEALGASRALPRRSDVLVLGPGLGQDAWAQTCVDAALADPRPLVVDADGLNLLSRRDAADKMGADVVTPHPKEAARLLGVTVAAVQADRLEAARAIVALTQAVCVLKGAHTVIAGPHELPVFVRVDEPTLAVGGSGDVLAGAIGALMAQGMEGFAASLLGASLHAQAGISLGAGQAQRGVEAAEIADGIARAMGHWLSGWRPDIKGSGSRS